MDNLINGELTELGGPARGGSMSPVWILKRLVSVFINACRSYCQLCRHCRNLAEGRERLSLVTISFLALSLLFGPCRLSEFTLAGPLLGFDWGNFGALDRWLVMGGGRSREVVTHRSLTYKLFGKLPAHLFSLNQCLYSLFSRRAKCWVRGGVGGQVFSLLYYTII